MRIKYKSEESYWIICLVSLLISIVCFILNRVFNDGIGGISFVLPIVMLVLTLIVKGGNFKDSKTGDTMMSAVLIIALVSYLGNISSLLSVSTSLYFKNASNLNTVLGSLGLVFGISAIIVVVVTAIAFALFASRQKNGENNKKLAVSTAWVSIILSVVVSVFGLLSLIFSNVQNGIYRMSAEAAVSISTALLIYRIMNNADAQVVQISSEAYAAQSVASAPAHTDKPSSLSEEEKIALIKKYFDLKEQGLISEEDFQKKKEDILSK